MNARTLRCSLPVLVSSIALTAATPALATTTSPGAPTYVRTIGRPAHAAMYPSGLDVDPSGRLYVADTGNDQVAAYDLSGNALWRVGGRGSRTLGHFNNPRDVAWMLVGGHPRLFVDDTGFNRVDVLDATTGKPLSSWSFRFPSTLGISAGVDGAGHPVVLVAEDIANQVQEFTPSGTLVRTIAGPSGTLNGPRDAATDAAGDVYVADYAHDRMVEFSPTGTVLRSWGSHGTAHGQFLRPYGVDLDAAGHVYVADSDNERVQEFTAVGGYLKTYGSRGTANGQFRQLRRVAVGSGSTPRVWGADLWDHHIDRFSQAGVFQRRFGNGAAAPGGFNEPSGLAVDSQTFVADTVNQRIEVFGSQSTAYLRMWGHRGWGKTDLGGFNWPRDLTIDPADNTIWVADTKNNRVTEFTRSGATTGRWFGLVRSGTTQLHWPFGIDYAGSRLVIADTFNNRVVAWDTQTLQPAWIAAGLHFPKDVAVSGSVVYVADTTANRVVRLDAQTGAVLGSFGSLHGPQGIAVAPDGNVWVADTSWNRLVEYASDGTFIRAVGSAGSGHGNFDYPTHIEIYGGELYVADSWNDRIEVYKLND